ncbi:MAG: hypothetical protein ACSHYA_07355 [Opitutaceae bacterium]
MLVFFSSVETPCGDHFNADKLATYTSSCEENEVSYGHSWADGDDALGGALNEATLTMFFVAYRGESQGLMNQFCSEAVFRKELLLF